MPTLADGYCHQVRALGQSRPLGVKGHDPASGLFVGLHAAAGRRFRSASPPARQTHNQLSHGWLRLNPLTLRVLLGHVRRTGAQLALLSNAPEPLARAIDHSRWSRYFDHRYYSCRLGAAKPGPQAFQLALSDLGVQPGEVLFIDDRAENIRAAGDLGMRSITFTSASALSRELRLTTRHSR